MHSASQALFLLSPLFSVSLVQIKPAEFVTYQYRAILVAAETKQRIPVAITRTAVDVAATLSQAGCDRINSHTNTQTHNQYEGASE